MTFWRRRRERELDEEIRFHLQMAARDRMEGNVSVDKEFGNVALVKEVTREMWGWSSLSTLLQDAHYALRTMRRSPGFTAVTVLTLALGIGANAALFSVFDAVLLKMLPVHDPHELFVLAETGPLETGRALVSYPLLQRLRQAVPAGVELLAATDANGVKVATGGGVARSARGQLVSGDYFSALGVRAAAGRLLGPEDDHVLGGHPVAVVSYRYWERLYGRDPGVVGSAISLNGAPFTIVGVAQPGFFGLSLGSNPDMWIPLMMQPQVNIVSSHASSGNFDSRKPYPPQEDVRWLHVMARVPSHQAPQNVVAVLNVVFRQNLERAAQFQRDNRERRLFLAHRLQLQPGDQGFALLRARFAEPLRALMAMVAMVLLIVCANLANLFLARSTARQKEIAIRLSIGASRARVLRQLLTESTMLSLIAGGLGFLLASWARSSLPRLLSISVDLRLDFRIIAFTAGLSAATGILLGLAPALGGIGVDPGSALKTGAARSGAGPRITFGKSLVIAQVALSMLLIAGAGLLARTLWNLLRSDTGFDREHILSVRIDPGAAGYKENQLPGLYDQILEQVKALPGALSATFSVSGIASGSSYSSGIYVPGYAPQQQENMSVQEDWVDPGYFATMGMPLLQGRDFDTRDSSNSPRVAIINQSMARHYFNGESPIGRRYSYGPSSSGFEIVGVAQDAKIKSLREPPKPLAYHPLRQELRYANSLDIRTAADPRALASQIRKAIGKAAPSLRVSDVATLAERIDGSVAQERLLARLAGSFALTALLLACMGIYGLTSYAMVRRTREIGLRMALGADRASVVRLMLRESIALVLIGLAIGAGALIPATRLIRAMLFGVTGTDPITISAAAGVMLVAALLAAYLPARRAAQVDPMVALRYE